MNACRSISAQRFYEHLLRTRDRYVPGDIVTIHGLRSDEEMHYHSFFVYDADPVTGMPMLVAANAGRPRVRSWESEMLSAPRRSIRSRVRPRLPWLESVIETSGRRERGAEGAADFGAGIADGRRRGSRLGVLQA